MRFGKEKEVEIFKALANKSTLQVGIEFNFDKVYKNNRAVRNAVTGIFHKIKNNADEYGLSQELVDMVQAGMDERKLAGHPSNRPTQVEETEKDIKSMVIDARDMAWDLVGRKLQRISNNKKKLDAISFKELGWLAAVSFDKGQILKGEATENIAVLAKIDANITADDALSMVLEARDKNVETNIGKG